MHRYLTLVIAPTQTVRIAASEIRRVAGASGKPWAIEIVAGDTAPRVVGYGWHYRNASGSVIRFPNAYRRAYGKPIYCPSTHRIEVGRTYLLRMAGVTL